MIDLKNFKKVCSWDYTYGFTFKSKVVVSTVVYLLKIGEDLYIDETCELNCMVRKHLRDLTFGIHSNKKMQESFCKNKTCDCYILAQVEAFGHPYNLKQSLIEKYSPSLNIDEKPISLSPALWVIDESEADDISIKIPKHYMKRFEELSRYHNIPVAKFILASAITMLEENNYIDSDQLMKEGIALIDNYLSKNPW